MSTHSDSDFFSSIREEIRETIDHIDKVSKEFIETEVKMQAAIFAAKNRPTKDEPVIFFLAFIDAFYQRLRTDVIAKFRGGIQKLLGAFALATIEQSIVALSASLAEAKQDFEITRIRLGELKDKFSQSAVKRHIQALIFLCSIECIMFTAAFIDLGLSIAASVASGITLAMCLTISTHSLVLFLRDKLKKPLTKNQIRMLVGLFMVIVVTIGWVRYRAMPETDGHNSPILLLMCIVITLIMLAFSAFYTLTHYPSDTDRTAQRDIEQKRKILKDKSDAINALEREIAELIKRRSTIASSKTEIIEAQNVLIERVASAYQEAIAAFRNYNCQMRTDGIVPDGFNQHFKMPKRDQDGNDSATLNSPQQ